MTESTDPQTPPAAMSPRPAMCHEKVWPDSGWHCYPCSRKSKRMVGDHWYCEQHAKFHEKWDAI